MDVYVALIIIAITLQAHHVQGQHEVRYHDNTVYIYSILNKTWPTSNDECQEKYNAQLATITSEKIQNHIHRDLTKLNSSSSYYWMGLHRTKQTGWQWGIPVTYRFQNWEPNSNGKNGDCVAVSVTTGHWRVAECTDTYPYICSATIPRVDKNMSLNVPGIKLRIKEASKICNKSGGMQLAIISSPKVQREVESFVDDKNATEYFIGLQFMGDNSYAWSDGTPLDGSREYTNWSHGHPNASHGECVVVTKQGGWKWTNARCFHPKDFICQRMFMKEETTTIKQEQSMTDVVEHKNMTSFTTMLMKVQTTSIQNDQQPLTTSGSKRTGQTQVGIIATICLQLFVLLSNI